MIESMVLADLPPAPGAPVNARGEIAWGAYRGFVGAIDWLPAARAARRGKLWRLLHGKRWHWIGLFGPDVAAAVAIIDLGWTSSGFAWVFDRKEKALVADLSAIARPGGARVTERPGEGRSAFHGGAMGLEVERTKHGWRVAASAKKFMLSALVSETPASQTLAAVAKIDGGLANCTHKTACLSADGTVAANGKRWELRRATAAIDHTHGLLARDTRWRWACAAGDRVGLNLVDGFNGPVENGLWIDGRLHKIGAASIELNAGKPLEPWSVRTEDGCVDLVFTPDGVRAEDKNLLVAASRYVQPIGTFRGTVRAPGGSAMQVEITGVTEDHRARW